MNILGIGTLFSRGLGTASLEQALLQGWQPPEHVPTKQAGGKNLIVYDVKLESIPEKTILKKLRRSDKVAKMATLAAADALADSDLNNVDGKNIGIILSTAFGPHETTFGFLDGVLDFGDAAVSPTAFSNSVHNAAASYISMALDIKGPSLTVSQFTFPFQSALLLAQTWLDQKRCDYVLVGAVDEYGDVFGTIAARKLTLAANGKVKPFVFNEAAKVPGEGAAFFLLTNEQGSNGYCTIDRIQFNYDIKPRSNADITIIDAGSLLPDESCYLTAIPMGGAPVASYTPLFGSLLIGAAFHTAIGALMLKKQFRYAVPVPDNPHALSLVEAPGPERLETIRTLGCGCSGEFALIDLKKISN